MDVGDLEELPHRYAWGDLKKNRLNKKNLVQFLCNRLKGSSLRLEDEQKLILSFEDEVWEISTVETAICQDLTTNHEEADTKISFLAHSFEYR